MRLKSAYLGLSTIGDRLKHMLYITRTSHGRSNMGRFHVKGLQILGREQIFYTMQ